MKAWIHRRDAETPRRTSGFVLALGIACTVVPVYSQNQPHIEKPHVPGFIRPYFAPSVPPIHLKNSNRLDSLIRAGNLYLTVQDAIALAIENNLNLEIDRYGPLLADSALERAKAGGPLRGVPAGNSQISSVNSGVGVNGTTAAAGLGGGGGGGGGGNSGGAATIQQVGQITPNLDPVLQNTSNFSHLTQPQANTVVSQTNALIEGQRVYNSVYSQGFLSGGQLQFREYQQYFHENAPDNINPSNSARMDLIYKQPLLQGFGPRLNDRTIRISQINTTAAREQFRLQLLNLVSSVLNLYWDMVSATDELKARQQALEIAQRFLEDTQKEIAAQALPGVQLPRAEAEVSMRRQELLIAQANVRQQEVLLKEAISHSEDPLLEAASVVPVDRIEIPATDDLRPLRELVTTAMAKRPDVALAKYRDQTTEMNLPGTTDPLLPSLNFTAQTYDRGVGGDGNIIRNQPPNPYFVGGYGNAFAQVFRHNFANYYSSLNFSVPTGNRSAQADYGIDQLSFRQGQLSGQKDTNAIVVDVAARMSALRQARSRYSAAQNTTLLQEQVLRADRQRFTSGGRGTTFDTVMLDDRALVTAQISELNALAAYARARISLDQVLGETLEKYHITLEEGLNGRVERQSQAPDVIGTPHR
jgi:outer membrane protein